MSIIQAIVYGIIQGIGEFLPISSSAHLVVAPWLFGWRDPGLAFNVALHLGTLIAVVVFFWKDWLNLIVAGISRPKTDEGKLFWFLMAATIPGAAIGKLFEETAETVFRNPALIGAMLLIMGIILYGVDRLGRKELEINNLGFLKSFLIGLSQAIAIIPGVSRSGITLTTGVLLGLTRENAARFSFLLSTPIILGAGLLKIKDLMHTQVETTPLLIGIVTSAIVGLLSIKFLLEYLKTKGFGLFALYRIILGVGIIFIYLLNLR